MNIIERKFSGGYTMRLKSNGVEALKRYSPKGCPFTNYTILDLLKDWMSAYSWKLQAKETTITQFIKQLQSEGEYKAIAYGDDIISILDASEEVIQ